MKRTLCAAAFGLSVGLPAAALEVRPDLSTDGVFQVVWESADPVVLLESRGPDFEETRVVYAGSDQAVVFTGQSDGRYRYRLRDSEETVTVEVRHHSHARARLFFAIGGAVFLATVFMVMRGASEDPNHG